MHTKLGQKLTNPNPPRQQNNLFSVNSKYKTLTQLKPISNTTQQHVQTSETYILLLLLLTRELQPATVIDGVVAGIMIWSPKKNSFFFFFWVWTCHARIQSNPMKIQKNRKIHTKSSDWYPKNYPNPSIFWNPKFGEIKNHKKKKHTLSTDTTLATAPTDFASSRNVVGGSICDGVELRREEEETRFGLAVLQVRSLNVLLCCVWKGLMVFNWVIVLCFECTGNKLFLLTWRVRILIFIFIFLTCGGEIFTFIFVTK